MLDSTAAPVVFQIRPAVASDFEFAYALLYSNMSAYYERHRLNWRHDLFINDWNVSENHILELDGKPIGFLRITVDGNSLHIRDIQIVPEQCGRGAGTHLMTRAHRLARERGLRELQLRVFSDNPAARLYLRMGYRRTGPSRAWNGAIHQMTRYV
jgi:ribosomal protein S18 acetylase RimI-like enzyme